MDDDGVVLRNHFPDHLLVGPAKSETAAKEEQSAKSGAESKEPKEKKAKVEVWSGKAEYIGDEMCGSCHDEVVTKWKKTRHGQTISHVGLTKEPQTCETCHGPGSEHPSDENHKKIYNPGKMSSREIVKRCVDCHSSTVKSVEWAASPHGNNDVRCSQCHDIHNPTKADHLLKQDTTKLCLSCHKKQNAEFRRNSHHPVLEGRLDCTDCHNPHKPAVVAGRKLKSTGENLCLKCHQQMKGPFLYEHDPLVSGLTEACQACHIPHGSPNPKLMKLFGRGLCLQCHTDRLPHFTGRKCWDVGCHSEVHGGKRPRLFGPTVTP